MTATHELAVEPTGPLAGVRVVECASIVLGPMAAQMLADMGADVIKVEPPEGDLTRRIGPRRTEGMGSFFLSNNRNKRSVVLDLKQPGDRAAFGTLLDSADVLLHSVRTPAAERLGLGYDELARTNPGLVHCQVTGFADDGPYGGRPAYDDIIQSLSGLAMLQTVVTGDPRFMPAIFADKVTAVHAALAVTAALVHRRATGHGQSVVVPMFETMAGFNVHEHLWGYAFEPPLGPMGYEPVSTAARRPFPTVDGFVSVLPYSDRQWRRFFELAGHEEVMADERFATFAARQRNVALVWGEIANQLRARTNAEWLELLEPEDIPFAVVNSLEDMTRDPHLVETGFWQLVEDPEDGTRRMPSPGTHFAGTPATIHRLPPRLGEHTREVLAEIGLTPEDLANPPAAKELEHR